MDSVSGPSRAARLIRRFSIRRSLPPTAALERYVRIRWALPQQPHKTSGKGDVLAPSMAFGPARANARALDGVRQCRTTAPSRPAGGFAVRIGNPADPSNPRVGGSHSASPGLQGARGGLTRAIHGPRPTGGFAVHIGSPADVSNRGVLIKSPLAPRYAKRPRRAGVLRIWRREGDSNPRSAV